MCITYQITQKRTSRRRVFISLLQHGRECCTVYNLSNDNIWAPIFRKSSAKEVYRRKHLGKAVRVNHRKSVLLLTNTV